MSRTESSSVVAYRECHSLQGGGRGGKIGVGGGGGESEGLACPVCGKLITGRNRRQRLQYHMSTHSGERPHHCPFCPYRAHHKFTLDRHVRTVHRDHFLPLEPHPGLPQTLASPQAPENIPSVGTSVPLPDYSRVDVGKIGTVVEETSIANTGGFSYMPDDRMATSDHS